MSKIDDRTRLNHMLEAARKIAQFIQNETRDSLETDEKLALAFAIDRNSR